MPHGISDSEWARVGAKSIGEYNEKMKEEQIARDSTVKSSPEDETLVAETPLEVEVSIPIEKVEAKPVAKKRGRPAKLKKLEVEKIVIPEVKKTKKTKRGKR